mgnify:CR=1 FL=1
MNAVVGPTTKRWDFAVRVPIVRDGVVKYVLSVVINPSAIQDLLTIQHLPPGIAMHRIDHFDQPQQVDLDPAPGQQCRAQGRALPGETLFRTQPHVPEVDRMAFGLEPDVALSQFAGQRF